MRNILLLFCFTIIVFQLPGQEQPQSIEEVLFNMPGIQFKLIEAHTDHKVFEIKVKQPLDHKNPDIGNFYQKVILVHRGFDKPMVMNTSGYSLSKRSPEIVPLLDANLLNIEHRYFGESTPKLIDWQYLNLKNVADDLHRINALFHEVYINKWISTGISKGGQTTIYYRYFYPDDVDVSIPYVAPVNNSISDQRIYDFLDNVGPEDCRKSVYDIQESLLINKEWMLDHLYWYSLAEEYTFKYVGGLEAAFELAVLEYPFSFWQGGSDCHMLPDIQDNNALLHHFLSAVGLSLYDDKLIEYYGPHYYQAATEMGYYTLRTKGLEEHLDKVGNNPSAAFPPSGISTTYDPNTNNEVHSWLKTLDEDMIFIYGEYDTWTATKADVGGRENILYFIVDREDHRGARMENLSESQWLQLVNYLKSRHGLVLRH